jgi:hypothetical protein
MAEPLGLHSQPQKMCENNLTHFFNFLKYIDFYRFCMKYCFLWLIHALLDCFNKQILPLPLQYTLIWANQNGLSKGIV